MQKIITEALKLAGYKNHEELARVVNATPNPIAATEMLLGVFEEIHPEAFGQMWRYKYDNNSIYLVDKLDSLMNTVYYTKYTHNTLTVFYATKEDYAEKKYVLKEPSNFYTTGSIRANGYTESQDSTSIDHFVDRYAKETKVDSLYVWIKDAKEYDPTPAYVESNIDLSA